MEKFYVTKESECPNCEGRGTVMQFDWCAYWANVSRGVFMANDLDAEIKFFSERGYSRRNMPDEEVECWKCQGTGILIEKVELGEALQSLGVTTWTR